MSESNDRWLDDLRRQFVTARPTYERLAAEMERRITLLMRDAGLYVTVSGRAKEVSSFVQKVLLKGYDAPWEQIRDKAGVRIVAAYFGDLPAIQAIIEQTFSILDTTDKVADLEDKTLGYRGFHYEVTIDEANAGQLGDGDETLLGLVCEIQLQTRAENLWNDVSHGLLYKPSADAPLDLKRRLYRLAALMELFDSELDRTRQEMAALPGSRASNVLTILREHFYRLTGHSFNKDLSLEILSTLLDKVATQDDELLKRQLTGFVNSRGPKLERLYDQFLGSDHAPALLFQPETILLLQELERDRFAVRDAWNEVFPASLLEEMASIWRIQFSNQ